MRSLISFVIERVLANSPRKEKLADPVVFDKRVADLLAQGETPYRLDYDRFSVDVEKRSAAGMDCYVLNSKGEKHSDRILYFHGGGFISQPISQHWKFLNRIAEDTGREIWMPIYPTIPYHDAEYAYGRLLEFYRYFLDSGDEGGKVVFMGDSAGGNLVLGMAQQIRDLKLKGPEELIMIAPFLDVAIPSPLVTEIDRKDAMLGIYGTRKCGEMWAGGKDLQDPLVSPLYGDIKNLGHMTIFTGTYDIVNPDSHRFLEKAEKEGIPIEFNEGQRMQHVYPLLPIPEAKRAIKRIEAIVLGTK